MKTRLSFLFLLAISCTLGLFTSCNNDDPIPPIELKTICKEYKYDKVFLVLNGDTLSPSVDMSLYFPDGQLPEVDTYESRMVLETTPPWLGADGNLYEQSNLKFEVDASSSAEEIAFSGKTIEDFLYSMEIKGTIRNDSVWMDMTYRTTKYNDLRDKTFELLMSGDSYFLGYLNENVKYQDTVVWNGVTYPTEDFVRESLDNIYKEYVAKTGIDAYRLTFREDGRIEVEARNVQTGNYIPVDGYFAYRFHKGYGSWGGGVFEVGMEEANKFYLDFIDGLGDSHFPNHLFQTYIRQRAYVPISLRSFYHTLSENEYEERLYLELVGFDDHGKGWWNFSYFLSEYTKFVNDFSDRTKRLRKISDLLWNKKIADEFMFYMKEVK